ncbi:MAG: family 16 glycoside hydrolase [Chitinispirillaceae bacterium]
MPRVPALCGLIVFILVCIAKSDNLFEDNFDTDDQWVTLFGDVTAEAQNGRYVVENTGGSVAVLKHSADFSNFSYRVSFEALASSFANAGVIFCWDDDAGGYQFTIGANKQFSLGKYTRDGNSFSPSTIDLGFNSFIKSSGSNELVISKSGSTIQISCNDVLLTEVEDPSFDSGDIGLVVNANETVSFDHVLVTDENVDVTPRYHFSDDFDDGDLYGWNTFVNAGTVENTGDALRLNAGNQNARTIVYTDGQYQNAPVKVIVERESGSEDAFYGVMLLSQNVTMSDTSYARGYDAFMFYINGAKQYAALSTEVTSFSPRNSSNINGTVDTLEITADRQFVVNGDVLSGADFGDASYDFNAVALIADSNVTVSFDEFEAGTPASIAYRPQVKDKIPMKKQFELGGTGIIYDPRGREVARVNDNNYKHVLKNLGNGSFIIITKKNGKHYPIRRAVVVK